MNTDEYVPSEEEVREAYALEGGRDTIGDLDYEEIPAGRAEFDRFLARVRRDAKAEAWQEGVNFALPGKETYWISKHNPHRATETRRQR